MAQVIQVPSSLINHLFAVNMLRKNWASTNCQLAHQNDNRIWSFEPGKTDYHIPML